MALAAASEEPLLRGCFVGAPQEPCPVLLPPIKGPPSPLRLAQLLFLAGHVALRTCVLLEQLQMELKQLRHLKADGTLPEQQQQAAAAEGIAAEGDSDSAARDTKARHSKHEQHQHAQARAQQQHQQIQQQVERNLGMQTREEDDVDLLQHLIEHGITQHGLLGGPYKRLILLGAFDPLKLVQRLGQQIPANDEKDSAAAAALLQQAAVLSLSKYAAVSKTFCDELLGPQTTTLHALISLLFAKEGRPELGAPRGGPPTPLEGPRTRLPKDVEPPGLKDAILVHPNALEPYNDYVFSLLREGAVSGQLTAVHVLTHLTMTGMIKPKGRLLVNMLLLQLQYPQQQDQPPRDWRVEEAARTFFFELAALLALPFSASAIALRRFILEFTKGRRQSEALIDKICIRESVSALKSVTEELLLKIAAARGYSDAEGGLSLADEGLEIMLREELKEVGKDTEKENEGEGGRRKQAEGEPPRSEVAPQSKSKPKETDSLTTQHGDFSLAPWVLVHTLYTDCALYIGGLASPLPQKPLPLCRETRHYNLHYRRHGMQRQYPPLPPEASYAFLA
ncbi:condensin related protein [Cyclospora cayetanensis]|uniref:Condensin related protein n=1 Tax=Cyclospora cayetanensis TaxID=88456 RepID=A0A1D3D775_9EIME|nr:condensin related protein [Cyclospora cayetanensis]